MMTLSQKIRQGIQSKACLVTGNMEQRGCRVDMAGFPKSRLVIDFDESGSPIDTNKTRPDYLVVVDSCNGSAWVLVLELKSGKVSADKVVKQLQAGASAAEKLVPKNQQLNFRPVLYYARMTAGNRLKLREKQSRINFRGKQKAVRLERCGSQLAEVLKRP
ncbi:MAG: hypothetical protein GDA39_09215 [Hyphomonadaceae bacterium]|nr:hypothetical protein [Hyphomonadaceae bacterium]